MIEDIFLKMDKAISLVLLLLEREWKMLDAKYKNNQRVSDLRQGLINKGGILIPLSLIDHKILFDDFEFTFFDVFVKLYKEIYKERDNIFTEFAFRTLIEMGFYRSQIIYADKLMREEKNHFRLLIWLSDYASIAIGNPKNFGYFQKLLAEFRNLLTKKEKIIMENMKEILTKQDSEKHDKAIEEIRKLILPIQGNLYARTETLPIFRGRKIKTMYSAWSHILHGNVLLLNDMFSEYGKGARHKLRAHWFLLLTGLNTVTHVATFLNDQELIDEVEEMTKKVKLIIDEVSMYWKQIESRK